MSKIAGSLSNSGEGGGAYPSRIALPFEASTDAGKIAFMAQQPYQGYYGAWVQFAAALIASVAALITVSALIYQAKAPQRLADDQRLTLARALASEHIAEAKVARDKLKHLDVVIVWLRERRVQKPADYWIKSVPPFLMVETALVRALGASTCMTRAVVREMYRELIDVCNEASNQATQPHNAASLASDIGTLRDGARDGLKELIDRYARVIGAQSVKDIDAIPYY